MICCCRTGVAALLATGVAGATVLTEGVAAGVAGDDVAVAAAGVADADVVGEVEVAAVDGVDGKTALEMFDGN